MEILQYLQRQFTYDAWANSEVLAAILAQESAPESAHWLRLMAHIVSAERLWMERLQHLPQSLPVWPQLTPAELKAHTAELAKLWPDLLKRSSVSSLATPIAYKNSKGEVWTNTVQDILTHVLFHSAYHRGQIAVLMRASGCTPAYTDFIHSVRQGLIES